MTPTYTTTRNGKSPSSPPPTSPSNGVINGSAYAVNINLWITLLTMRTVTCIVTM